MTKCFSLWAIKLIRIIRIISLILSMLPKLYRLTGQANFKRIATLGRSFFLKEMGIKWLPNQLNNSRFAFVISTQVDKRAVARNKIKRRLRDFFHHQLKNIKPGFDILVLTRPAIKNLEFREMGRLVEGLLAKSQLFKN